MMDIKTCIEKRYLIKTKPDFELSNKELKEADYDLEKAKNASDEDDYKWCIIKCYYSMFHAAKSLLYKSGYVEKKHIAVIIVLEELNKEGKIEIKHINNFKAAMSAREDADYHYTYSKEIAEHDLEMCAGFLEAVKKIL